MWPLVKIGFKQKIKKKITKERKTKGEALS